MSNIELNAWNIMFQRTTLDEAEVTVSASGSIRFFKAIGGPYVSSISRLIIDKLGIVYGIKDRKIVIDRAVYDKFRRIGVKVIEMPNANLVEVEDDMCLYHDTVDNNRSSKLVGLNPKNISLYDYIFSESIIEAYRTRNTKYVLMYVAKDSKSTIDEVKFAVRVATSSIIFLIGDGAGRSAYEYK